MSAVVAARAPRRGVVGRVWAALLGGWGIVTGLAPHVLHHVGPLAGAALLAGFGGKLLFFALGLVLSLPLLRRLYRRFRTLLAPALAVVVFAAMFTLSTLVIAPLVTGGSEKSPARGIEQPNDHASHHSGVGK
jgi:Kef-type K+ transport system membrane component KefB